MTIDEIITKIKKAIRLANKTTEEGERETAMRLAKSLADKHGIAFDEITITGEIADKAVQIKEDYKPYDNVIDGNIAVILQKHFGVVVMLNMRRYRSNYCKRAYTYFGSVLNIDLAKYVAEILNRECRKAWRITSKESFFDLGFKPSRRAFINGWFYKIHKKLTDNPIRNDIAADTEEAKKAYEKYRDEQGGAIQEKSVGAHKNDDSASLYRGYMMADAVSLNRPCQGGGDNPELVRRTQLDYKK